MLNHFTLCLYPELGISVHCPKTIIMANIGWAGFLFPASMEYYKVSSYKEANRKAMVWYQELQQLVFLTRCFQAIAILKTYNKAKLVYFAHIYIQRDQCQPRSPSPNPNPRREKELQTAST